MGTGAIEAQRRQRIDGRIDGGDAPFQDRKQFVRADLVSAKQVDDRAGVGAVEIGTDRRPPSSSARRAETSAANPKFAPQLPRVRLRTSGSKRH